MLFLFETDRLGMIFEVRYTVLKVTLQKIKPATGSNRGFHLLNSTIRGYS